MGDTHSGLGSCGLWHGPARGSSHGVGLSSSLMPSERSRLSHGPIVGVSVGLSHP